MAHRKVYDNHLDALVKCLPMDDSCFIVKLPSYLLPKDTKDQIKAIPLKADKSLYFLNTVIKPSLEIGDASTFDALIYVMQNSGYDNVKMVADKIKFEIDSVGTKSGTFYVHMYH